MLHQPPMRTRSPSHFPPWTTYKSRYEHACFSRKQQTITFCTSENVSDYVSKICHHGLSIGFKPQSATPTWRRTATLRRISCDSFFEKLNKADPESTYIASKLDKTGSKDYGAATDFDSTEQGIIIIPMGGFSRCGDSLIDRE